MMRGDRVISSIPRDNTGDENKCPHKGHGKAVNLESNSNDLAHSSDLVNSNDLTLDSHSKTLDNWVYPSPKMFWNAMHRKGTLPSHLSDPQNPQTKQELDWIVTIHNVVNEQCWQEVCKWERFRAEGCKGINRDGADDKISVDESLIKLQRFLGRPDDLSPRAWFKSTILGYRKPFDRHDWYITNSNNSSPPRRYVIDFYAGNQQSKADAATSFYLDVRPAADSVDSIELRVRKYLCEKMTEFKNKFMKQ